MRIARVGECPFLGILDITFKYLLEMKYPEWLGDVQLGHLPTPELVMELTIQNLNHPES